MTHRAIAKNNMYKKMLLFFDNSSYNSVWANFTRFKDEIIKFAKLNIQLEDYIQQNQLDNTGITTGNNNAFSVMIDITVNKAQKAYVWALDANNADLQQLFDVQKTDFNHMPEASAFSRVKNIRDAINTNIASMKSIQLTNTDVTYLDSNITAYELTESSPSLTQTHKQACMQALENVMHPIDLSLDIITRLIISEYSYSHADMVAEFSLNKHIDTLPTHSTGVHIHITDFITNTDLQNALISIEGNIKTATTNIDGLAEIIKIKNGTYYIIISLAGYVTQTIKTDVLRGKITELTVQLKKAD